MSKSNAITNTIFGSELTVYSIYISKYQIIVVLNITAQGTEQVTACPTPLMHLTHNKRVTK